MAGKQMFQPLWTVVTRRSKNVAFPGHWTYIATGLLYRKKGVSFFSERDAEHLCSATFSLRSTLEMG